MLDTNVISTYPRSSIFLAVLGLWNMVRSAHFRLTREPKDIHKHSLQVDNNPSLSK
jgi:hypothetical protein